MTITIGYAVMGRNLHSRNGGVYAYDELTILERLARLYPEVDFYVFGQAKDHVVDAPNVHAPLAAFKNSDYEGCLGAAETALAKCDHALVFLNQHNSVSLKDRVAKIKGNGVVTPLVQPTTLVAPVIHALNCWQDADPTRDPVFICNDPRSTLKARDLKYPPRRPILSQWNGEGTLKHYRFGDVRSPSSLGFDADAATVPGHWVATHQYTYAQVELTAL